MKITTQNRAAVKALMKILIAMSLSEEAVKMITTALQTENQMDVLVNFIKSNPNATETEIIKKVQEIIE